MAPLARRKGSTHHSYALSGSMVQPMTDTRQATKSLLGLPVSPPPLNVEDAPEPLLMTAEEGYARRAAREKEFVERVIPHSALLLGYAWSQLQLKEDAENAVQDVMLKAGNA